LIAIGNTSIVFPPRRLLGVSEKVRASDVVMVADLGAAQTAEIFLGHGICKVRGIDRRS
jgi:hypothetical protein